MTTHIDIDVDIHTTSKFTEVYAMCFTQLAFYDLTLSTDVDLLREFVIDKIETGTDLGTGVVLLRSMDSGDLFHSGEGIRSFAGTLTGEYVDVNGTILAIDSTADALHRTLIACKDGINKSVWSFSYLNPDLVNDDDMLAAFNEDMSKIDANVSIQTTNAIDSLTVYCYAMAFTTPKSATQLSLSMNSHPTALLPVQSVPLGVHPNAVNRDFQFTSVVDSNNDIVGASKVNAAYIYILASDSSSVSTISGSQYDYGEAHITAIDNKPYIVLTNSVKSSTSFTISSSVFSSITDIVNTYTFSFLTNVTGSSTHVDPEDLTESNIMSFFQTYLLPHIDSTGYLELTSQYGTTSGKNLVHNDDTRVSKDDCHFFTNVEINTAFRTLTPTSTSGADLKDISSEIGWYYAPCVVAVDANGIYGVLRPGRDGSIPARAAKSGLQLKIDYPSKPSGTYWIQSDAMKAVSQPPLEMYVDMRDAMDGGGYDYYVVTSGPSYGRVADNFAFKNKGLQQWVPRTPNSWRSFKDYRVSQLSDSVTSVRYIYNVPVYNPNNVRNYSGNIMRSTGYLTSGGTLIDRNWRVPDGGRWWLRNNTTGINEPNGNYTIGNYLGNNILYNDGLIDYFDDHTSLWNSGSSYILSTNAKYSPSDITSTSDPSGW